MENTIFMTKVRSAYGKSIVRKLISSIRTFGGSMSNLPVWIFEVDSIKAPCKDLESETVRVIPLKVPDHTLNYEFGDKVYACAKAEELAPSNVQSLAWLDPLCLVVNPPVLFDLEGFYDVAVRPVHIRNVGLLQTDPLDSYWKKIYQTAGCEDIRTTVESFVDRQQIRAYYNTHAFSINPAAGILRRWFQLFDRLVCDQSFQAGSCQDEAHHIFLHQAVFSTLVALLPPEKIRHLPPEYSYPFHLHSSVSQDRQARTMNDLVCLALEDPIEDLSLINDIQINEPLKSWLLDHI